MAQHPHPPHAKRLVQSAIKSNKDYQLHLNKFAHELAEDLQELDQLIRATELGDADEGPEDDYYGSIRIVGSKKAKSPVSSSELHSEESPFFEDTIKRDTYFRLVNIHPMRQKDLDALAEAVRTENYRICAFERKRQGRNALNLSQDTSIDLSSNIEGLDWERVSERVTEAANLTRTARECEVRWLGHSHPRFKHGRWTTEERRKLSDIVEEKSKSRPKAPLNWGEIAKELGTNRTMIDCFRKSLNRKNHVWDYDSDIRLEEAVAAYGTDNWPLVSRYVSPDAFSSQCHIRYTNVHDPNTVKRKWSLQDDERLREAVDVIGGAAYEREIAALLMVGKEGERDEEIEMEKEREKEQEREREKEKEGEKEDKAAMSEKDKDRERWMDVALFLPGRTNEDCRLRWRALYEKDRFDKERAAGLVNFSKEDQQIGIGKPWSDEDINKLKELVARRVGFDWEGVSREMDGGRDADECRAQWDRLQNASTSAISDAPSCSSLFSLPSVQTSTSINSISTSYSTPAPTPSSSTSLLQITPSTSTSSSSTAFSTTTTTAAFSFSSSALHKDKEKERDKEKDRQRPASVATQLRQLGQSYQALTGSFRFQGAAGRKRGRGASNTNTGSNAGVSARGRGRGRGRGKEQKGKGNGGRNVSLRDTLKAAEGMMGREGMGMEERADDGEQGEQGSSAGDLLGWEQEEQERRQQQSPNELPEEEENPRDVRFDVFDVGMASKASMAAGKRWKPDDSGKGKAREDEDVDVQMEMGDLERGRGTERTISGSSLQVPGGGNEVGSLAGSSLQWMSPDNGAASTPAARGTTKRPRGRPRKNPPSTTTTARKTKEIQGDHNHSVPANDPIAGSSTSIPNVQAENSGASAVTSIKPRAKPKPRARAKTKTQTKVNDLGGEGGRVSPSGDVQQDSSVRPKPRPRGRPRKVKEKEQGQEREQEGSSVMGIGVGPSG